MRLAELVSRKGHEVYVLTGTSAHVETNEYKIYNSIKRWNWLAIIDIVNTVKHLQPSVVDLHYAGWIFDDHPMITFLPALLKRLCPKTHICVHIESLGGALRERNNSITAAIRFACSLIAGRHGINFEYGTLIRDCDSLIVLSDKARKELCATFPAAKEKCVVMPPPPIMRIAPLMDEITKRGLISRFALEDRQIKLAFFGYLYPGKGLETLFEAVSALKKHGYDIALLLLGDVPEQAALVRCNRPDYLKELQDLSKKLDIEKELRWLGYSEHTSELPSRALQISDICVLPFDTGVKLNNSSFSYAACHALPIITTFSEESESVFLDRINTVLVAPKDSAALTTAIEELARNASLRAQLSAGAKKLAGEIYNWDESVARTLKWWGI